MTIPHLAAMVVLGASVGLAQAAPGNPDAAKNKLSMCAGCHGIPGYHASFPSVYHVPRLGGQHPAYIVKALQEYQSGERSHPTMRAIAAGLTEQDMANLAAYYGAPQQGEKK
jgi:cytochrome c553